MRAAGFDPKVISVFSLTGKRGSVVAQDPKPESRAREGSVLEIAVSRGANRVEVTDVVGKTLAEVRPPFDDAGIRIEVTEETSETAAKGIIIRQDPGPGVVVTGKDTVRFVVSKGADPRPVPQVAGLQPVGAGYELGKAGLTVGTSAAVNDPSVVVGAVVSTDPPAGTPVEKDRAINLAVSAGPAPVPVPEVRNQPVDAAVAAVRQAGLVPNLVSSAGGSHVINQDPAPAAPLTPGLAGDPHPRAAVGHDDDHDRASHDGATHDGAAGTGRARRPGWLTWRPDRPIRRRRSPIADRPGTCAVVAAPGTPDDSGPTANPKPSTSARTRGRPSSDWSRSGSCSCSRRSRSAG